MLAKFVVLYFLFCYCFLIPQSVYRGYRKLLKTPLPDISRKKLYLRTIASLLLLVALALLVVHQIEDIDIFVPWHPSAAEIGLGLLLLCGTYALREWMLPWLKKTSPPNSPLRMPTTWKQLALWSCVSVLAGVTEEIIYRGVMFACLVWYFPQPLLVAVICSAVFAVAHFHQGPRSAWFIFFLALAMHGLVWLSGTLYMAMIVHATYDFAVGLRNVLVLQQADREYKPA